MNDTHTRAYSREKIWLSGAYLSHKHGPWGNLHVVAQLKILQKHQSLVHADITVYLEAHIRDGSSRVQVPDDVLCDDVQSWSLHIYRRKELKTVNW